MNEQKSLSDDKVDVVPCGCDEMSVCTECVTKRAVACPGLPGRYECGRGATTPGEMKLYGHCLLCEGLVDAERRFREAETGRKANQNLNELPLPGYVRQVDACRFLGLYDSLSKAFNALKHQELEAVTLLMRGGDTTEPLLDLIRKNLSEHNALVEKFKNKVAVDAFIVCERRNDGKV